MEFLLVFLGLLGMVGAAGGGGGSRNISSGGPTTIDPPTISPTPNPPTQPVPSTREAAFEEFVSSGDYQSATSTDLLGITYNQRAEEPLHEDFKFQDPDGNWWSPDYFVVVAGGQSNMMGLGQGAPLILNPNVITPNIRTGELEISRYELSGRNNLQLPFSNRAVAELEQPVLLINTAQSGSSINSWLIDGDNDTPGIFRDAQNDEVTKALQDVGQDQVDVYLWLQGETDYPLTIEDFAAKVEAYIAQTRGEDWAAPDLPILIGELSREGVNQAQNAGLQLVETTEDDPNLVFVSSVGLTSDEPDGIHYDGVSLVDYGQNRFWDAYLDVLSERANPGSTTTDNQAPEIAIPTNAATTPPADILLRAGDSIQLDTVGFFTDPDGDMLFPYAFLTERGNNFYDPKDGKIELTPAVDDFGMFQLNLYVSDYLLDSESIPVRLIVFEHDLPAAQPSVLSFTNRSFSQLEETNVSYYEAALNLNDGDGIEILDMSALPASGASISSDNLFIKGAAGISGNFQLDAGISRVTLLGDADFDVGGNTDANRIEGNDGDNSLSGLDGADRLIGGAGNDRLFGGADNDILYGDSGIDYLKAGSGSDQAYGGEGSDIFNFSKGDELLQIRDYDFADEGDVIELSGFASVTSYAEFLANADIKQSTTQPRLEITIEDDRLFIYDIEEDDLEEAMFSII